MGYVFDFKDARAYEQWIAFNRIPVPLLYSLCLEMLQPKSGESILDIGCGTGLGFPALLDAGLQVSGVDPSAYMLDIAQTRAGHRVDLHRGWAEDLPFADNAFHQACLITSLEFVQDPCKALAEAARVAKNQLFIGWINRYALKGAFLRIRGKFSPSAYNHAKLLSIWEVKRWIHQMLGDVPTDWRTLYLRPRSTARSGPQKSGFSLLQHGPFGAIGVMRVMLVPRYRTTPLQLSYPVKPPTGVVPAA